MPREIQQMMLFRPDYLRQQPAWFHTRILVGPGAYLTPGFCAQHNITAVINCAWDVDSPEWYRKTNALWYVAMNAIDSPTENILKWYHVFEQYMKNFLRNTNGTVYVHCQAGMNRSGFLALAYVCKNFHVPFENGIRDGLRQRPCLFQNQTFKNQVKEFVNGDLSSPQSPGSGGNGNDSWYSRFLASGTGLEPPRIFGAAGNAEAGTRNPHI